MVIFDRSEIEILEVDLRIVDRSLLRGWSVASFLSWPIGLTLLYVVFMGGEFAKTGHFDVVLASFWGMMAACYGVLVYRWYWCTYSFHTCDSDIAHAPPFTSERMLGLYDKLSPAGKARLRQCMSDPKSGMDDVTAKTMAKFCHDLRIEYSIKADRLAHVEALEAILERERRHAPNGA